MAYDMTAVDFDGTNDYFDHTHNVDHPGDDGIWFVANFYIRALPSSDQYICLFEHAKTSGASRAGHFWLITDDGTLWVRCRGGTAGAPAGEMKITGLAAGQWYQVAGALRRNALADYHMILNGVSQTLVDASEANQAFDWLRTACNLGRRPSDGSAYFNGYIGDFVIGGGFHDFRIPANLAKVWEPGGGLIAGCPVDIGPTGALITGIEPLYCFRGNTAQPDDPAQYNNKTSDGPFTPVGAVGTAASSPSDGCGTPPAGPGPQVGTVEDFGGAVDATQHDFTVTVDAGQSRGLLVAVQMAQVGSSSPSTITATLDPTGINKAMSLVAEAGHGLAGTSREQSALFWLDDADLPAAAQYTLRINLSRNAPVIVAAMNLGDAAQKVPDNTATDTSTFSGVGVAFTTQQPDSLVLSSTLQTKLFAWTEYPESDARWFERQQATPHDMGGMGTREIRGLPSTVTVSVSATTSGQRLAMAVCEIEDVNARQPAGGAALMGL